MTTPLVLEPSCAMQRPLMTRGDMAVKKLGQPRMSSLRQTNLPSAASRHDNVPRTPRVMTLPSATVGELRGPGCFPAGPVAGKLSYLLLQMALPVAASRH